MDDAQHGEPAVRLAVVEVLDRDGHARQVVPVQRWPATLGRAIDCDVVLDDLHVAARHATLQQGDDGALRLQVGDSINGARVHGRRLQPGEQVELPPGEVFQLAGVRLRVRRAGDALAPERPMAPEPAGGWLPLAVMALLLLAWNTAEQWLGTDPGGHFTDYLPVLVGAPVGIALWCGMWALGSKLFHHRFEFWPHAHIALSYLLVAAAIGLVLPLASYALSWEFASRISGAVTAAVLCAMVLAHLSLILPARRRLLAAGMAAAFAAGVAVMLVRNYQNNDRFFDELYVTTLAPPALRLAPAVETGRFIGEARQLKGLLDRHIKDDDNASPDVEEE